MGQRKEGLPQLLHDLNVLEVNVGSGCRVNDTEDSIHSNGGQHARVLRHDLNIQTHHHLSLTVRSVTLNTSHASPVSAISHSLVDRLTPIVLSLTPRSRQTFQCGIWHQWKLGLLLLFVPADFVAVSI